MAQEDKPEDPSTVEKLADAAVAPESSRVEEEPDFDDLDDVLDQFSPDPPLTVLENKEGTQVAAPKASGPGRPAESKDDKETTDRLAPLPGESDDDFIARLTAEMSRTLGSSDQDPATANASQPDISNMSKELDEFSRAMEEEGIQPGDLLKALMGEAATSASPHPKPESGGQAEPSKAPTPSPPASSSSADKNTASSFESTLRATMNRMQASDTSAKAEASNQETQSEEALLANLLKNLDSDPSSGADAANGTDDSLAPLLMSMMTQLTHKDILYEPMKELDTKYPSWLAEHKPPSDAKISAEDYKRFEGQSVLAAEIVAKFEEKGYSDDNKECREFVWDRMQKMQELGSPPQDLVGDPLDGGGIPGLGGDVGGLEGMEEGCPTQ